MKHVLVTGAAGFLGSHLAYHHLQAGDCVVGVDDFSSSTRSSEHVRRLCADGAFTMVEGNIASFEGGWRARVKNIRFDVIYNFACPASPPKYQALPVHTMMTCVVGTNNVLQLAARWGSRVVHASTSEVYGDPDKSPQREDYRGCVNSYGPRACYDEGKRAAEALCFDYRSKFNVDARLVRIFNTYGPHMDPNDGRVVSNFIRQALKGDKLTIYGDGKQTRSFCYVSDLIRGIVAMGELPHNPEGPINLGNPVEFTVKELAEVVGEKAMVGFNRRTSLVIEPLPVDDPVQRCPNISRAKKFLNWEPQVGLEEGLDRTIAYFKTVV